MADPAEGRINRRAQWKVMMLGWVVILLTGLLPVVSDPVSGLEGLALAGRWDEVLTVAVRRQGQLPLRPGEALVAAHAARLAGDTTAEVLFLERALDSLDLGAVARVELAELLMSREPDRSLDLVINLLRRAPTIQLRNRALEVAETTVDAGAGAEMRSRLEGRMSAIDKSSRRGIEFALARTATPVDRSRLSRLLASSTRDLVALDAAGLLVSSGELGVVDRWRVAQTYYRHGHYDQAAPILEDLDGVSHSQVPRREVAYLRGRCAFRRGEWPVAEEWYQKAISRTSAGERRAELEVHLGRTYELAGDLDQAVAAAQRAVRLRTTDDRRLFLARLRLRRAEPDLAQAGLSRLRSRSNRARGELMLGLYELKMGNEGSARGHLEGVSRDPWRGPATVFTAELEFASGKQTAALQTLIGGVSGLDEFWADQARDVMVGLSPELVAAWRRLEIEALGDPAEKTRRRAMARSLKLETEKDALDRFRSRAWSEVGLEAATDTPSFPPGLAARLWSLGLKTSALRWDPSGLPRDAPSSTAWTAETELELGRPWLAISAADAARWQASSFLPSRGLPLGLRLALYPLPYGSMVRDAAGRHGLDWTLLAGVAREESRWKPTVVSKVGARGLMQLMPATAAATATANGRPEIHPDDLFEPLISLDLGAAELGRLVAVFKGNRAAAVSAYNAGEAQALLWLNQCGEGCTEARFLAQVSFSVTRGYTEAVLASAAVYEELYGKPVSERSE